MKKFKPTTITIILKIITVLPMIGVKRRLSGIKKRLTGRKRRLLIGVKKIGAIRYVVHSSLFF